MINKKEIGHRLRELRKAFGLTIDQVSKKTGINESTLSRVENGKTHVSVEMLGKLSNLYGGLHNVIHYVLLRENSEKM